MSLERILEKTRRAMLLAIFIVGLMSQHLSLASPNKPLPIDQANLAKLSDALSVARSPYEPVTLAATSSDGARLDDFVSDSKSLTTRAVDVKDAEAANPTTEAQSASTTTKEEPLTTTPTHEESSTSRSTETETINNVETEVTTTLAITSTSTSTSTTMSPMTTSAKVEEPENDTTELTATTTPSPSSDNSASSALPPITTTTPDIITETGVVSETTSDQSNETTEPAVDPQRDMHSSSTSGPPIDSSSSSTSATDIVESQPATTKTSNINIEKTGEVSSVAIEPSTTPQQETSSVSIEADQSSSPTPLVEPERASTEAQPPVEPAATEAAKQPESESSSPGSIESESGQPNPTEAPPVSEQPLPASTEAPSEISTTPELINQTSPSTIQTTTPEPTSTTTTTTTIKPATNLEDDSKPIEKGSESSDKPAVQADRAETDGIKHPSLGCNHLPTYEPEEIQKVFREETTYKNGTIKGKFTYINFDQRYRLVHYTRLPYGPIKIDFVDDLGRPDQKNSQPGGGAPNRTSDDTPDSVLQLRNILPNSLFGFPFLNPSYKPIISDHRLGDGQGSQPGQDSSRGNPFYYSTDSIATPNLPSRVVPISMTPGKRRFDEAPNHATFNQAGTIGDIHYASNPSLTSYGDANLQMQYQLASQTGIASDGLIPSIDGSSLFANTQPSPFIASHNSQNNHNQFKVLQIPSIIPHNQPSFFSAPPGPFHPNLGYAKPIFEYHTSGQLQRTHNSPMGPFMFLNDNSRSESLPPTTPHVKLRVKTSRNLGAGSGVKSAQMRSAPSESQQAHSSSPVQSFRVQRQRSGKQSSELRAPVNSRPIVYHVLANRTPHSGSSLASRGKHDFSVAYDHEN